MLAESTKSCASSRVSALIAWALMGGPVWAWIGVVPLATGLIGWCPVYPLLGMNTCPTKK